MTTTTTRWGPFTVLATAGFLVVRGTLPPELRGRYLRNGHNPKPGVTPSHWFKGSGMVHGLRLENGRAEWYRNRWVRTPDLTASVAGTHVIEHGGLVDPRRSLTRDRADLYVREGHRLVNVVEERAFPVTLSRRGLLVAGGAGLAALGTSRFAEAATWETVINGSFANYSTLESAWNYRYPWGSDHNGTARMYASASDHNHVYLEGSTLVIKATRINWNEGNSSKDPYLPIRYHSGAVHAKQHVLVNDQFPEWEVKGEFQAPSARGTWPAFWLTGVNSWPPESDILEYKGDARNWFNTYKNASGGWSNTIRSVSSPGSWHTYRAWIAKVSATDVDIHYYLDGTWVGQHRGANFVGKPMWIIINLQMEGSSGSSGPTSDTYYRARNIYVGRNRA